MRTNWKKKYEELIVKYGFLQAKYRILDGTATFDDWIVVSLSSNLPLINSNKMNKEFVVKRIRRMK